MNIFILNQTTIVTVRDKAKAKSSEEERRRKIITEIAEYEEDRRVIHHPRVRDRLVTHCSDALQLQYIGYSQQSTALHLLPTVCLLTPTLRLARAE